MKKYLPLLLILALTAHARPKKKSPPPPPENLPTEVKVDIPQSEIELPAPKSDAVRLSRWGLEVSSWSPEGISFPTYLPGTTEFKTTKVPYLIFENVQSFYERPYLRIDRRAGLSYLRMRRSAPPSGAVIGTTRQHLHFFALPVGLEIHSPAVEWWIFTPYFQTNLIPAMAFTPRSNIEKGSAALGLFYDLKLGFQAELRLFDPVSDPRYFFNIAAGLTGGTLKSSHNIKGFIEGGLQVAF